MMLVIWTGLSYTLPGKIPSAVPRRLVCPLPWESTYHWTVVKVTFQTLYNFFNFLGNKIRPLMVKIGFIRCILKMVPNPILHFDLTRVETYHISKNTRITVTIFKM